ncbi:MAG: hypothetical protein C4342_08840, partial [Armatimonadota bacterium]
MGEVNLGAMLGSRFTFAILVAGFTALLLTPVVRKLALLAGAVDMPDADRRVHKEPTPRWGGLAIYLAVVAAWLVVYPISHHPAGVPLLGAYTVNSIWIIGLGGLIVLFGMLDDV